MKHTIRLFLMLFTLTAVQQASADCYIYVNICAPGLGIAPNSFFKDSDTSFLTQHNPNRCLERAREYLSYCQAPPSLGIAASYYYAHGAWKTAVVVAKGYSQLYTTDFANNWIPVKKDY